jgi:hypothetical protein
MVWKANLIRSEIRSRAELNCALPLFCTLRTNKISRTDQLVQVDYVRVVDLDSGASKTDICAIRVVTISERAGQPANVRWINPPTHEQLVRSVRALAVLQARIDHAQPSQPKRRKRQPHPPKAATTDKTDNRFAEWAAMERPLLADSVEKVLSGSGPIF